MRSVPDTLHGLGMRPFYQPDELDREFERLVSKYLRRRRGTIEFPLTTDDLTVLVEEHVDDLDLYADLEPFGAGVEGVTLFSPGAKPKVRVSSALGESDARENRLRTTLSHEFGHVHLHSYIVELAVQEGRIDRKTGGKIVCKRETMLDAPAKDWREWQAGYACGAILMPATRVGSVVEGWRKDYRGGAAGAEQALTGEIAKVFQVSKEAAGVRLRVLSLTPVAVP